MKKTKLSLALATFVLAGAVMITSCKKKDTTTTTPDTSTTSATDNSMAQQHASDITNIGSQGIENNGSLSTYRLGSGNLNSVMNASVTINTSAKNMTVVFDGTMGPDGHTRNGTIFYDWSASASTAVWYRDAGFVLNVSTPGNTYSVDGYTVEITQKTIKNLGPIGTNSSYEWSDASNITVLKPASAGGGSIQWQGNWTSTLLNTNNYTYSGNGVAYNGIYPNSTNGLTYINWNNALISITGTFSGTASDGETYTGNISTPLVLNLNCTSPQYSRYLYVAGVLNFTPTGKTTRTINYGTGACDLTYVVSIGSFSLTITL